LRREGWGEGEPFVESQSASENIRRIKMHPTNVNHLEAMLLRYGSLFLAVVVTGCVTSDGAVPNKLQRWDKSCYRSLELDIQAIAAGRLKDCGLVPIGAKQFEKAAATDCARKAFEEHNPFKVGYESVGEDSKYCSITIMKTGGEIWSLYFDQDVTGQFGLNGDNSAIWVQRCEEMDILNDSVQPKRCKENQEMLDKVLSSRKD
jgi:hypothetical protein